MLSKRFTVYPVIILAMLFWGMSFIWTKIVFRYYDPITTIFLRLVLSSIILFGYLKISGKLQKIRREDWKLILLSSLFNPFFYFLGENFGLKYSTSTISAAIIATIPLFVPMVAHFKLKEKLARINIFGIIVSFAGVLIMLVNDDMTLNASPAGIGFLLFAVVSAVVYSIMLKILVQKYSPVMIIAVQNLIGIVYFMPLFFIFGFKTFITVQPNMELILSLLQLAFFASSLAFVFFTYSTREIGVSRTNVFSNTIPVFTGILSYFILNEIFTFNKITGIVIIILGVLMTQVGRMNNEAQRHKGTKAQS